MSSATVFTPTGTVYHVRLLKAQEQSSGGIWLPEIAQENFTEAEVLAAGPGMSIVAPDGDTHRSVMWAHPGDHVLFQKHAFVPFSNGGQEGTVRDEDLVGVVRETVSPMAFIASPEQFPAGDLFELGRPVLVRDVEGIRPFPVMDEVIEPLNDWVRVSPSPYQRISDTIEQPDAYKRAPLRGVVGDLGPGRLRLTGKLAGLRVPIFRELGLRSSYGLLGHVVRWGENAEVLDVGGEMLECVLVRSSDILALEEEAEDGSSP